MGQRWQGLAGLEEIRMGSGLERDKFGKGMYGRGSGRMSKIAESLSE